MWKVYFSINFNGVFFFFNLIQGWILTAVGITIALCSAPVVAFFNMIALSIWPTWMMVAVSEIFRKVHIKFG